MYLVRASTMPTLILVLVALLPAADSDKAQRPLGPGDHDRSITVDGWKRTYHVHVPPKYDAKKPTPVVLAFHGAAMTGPMMARFSDLDAKADQAGFIVVYPDGTGPAGLLLTWNAGGWQGEAAKNRPDDVKCTARLLDDLAGVVSVDSKRVYAVGMSNGAMMCYRLAAELSDRIAAIAPVGGTMTLAADKVKLKRPVSVIHFHGTDDHLVPPGGPAEKSPKLLTFLSLDDTIAAWVKLDGCPAEPKITKLPDKAGDGTTITRKSHGPGADGAEVVLYLIGGGGHTWPGQEPMVGLLGKSTKNLSANDLIWEFLERHPMK
jgi:polyhydroxybutyrate depolymerase